MTKSGYEKVFRNALPEGLQHYVCFKMHKMIDINKSNLRVIKFQHSCVLKFFLNFI